MSRTERRTCGNCDLSLPLDHNAPCPQCGSRNLIVEIRKTHGLLMSGHLSGVSEHREIHRPRKWLKPTVISADVLLGVALIPLGPVAEIVRLPVDHWVMPKLKDRLTRRPWPGPPEPGDEERITRRYFEAP
jgi:RNA polymerase subunit RPABC4/transcription elongation factor Spt4